MGDGSPFDGLLWLLQDPANFERATTTSSREGWSAGPQQEEVWSLIKPVFPSDISAYWRVQLHMTSNSSSGQRRLKELKVYGLGVDGANHTLEEVYDEMHVPGRTPPPSSFLRPSQCGKCVNCGR